MSPASEAVIGSEIVCVVVDSAEAPELRVVRVENDAVLAGDVDSHSVVGEALRWVEVKCEQKAGALKYDHFVILVFPAYITLKNSTDQLEHETNQTKKLLNKQINQSTIYR